MSLREYKHKRHFNRTPEPKGKSGSGDGYSFVIQKHAASHLHYDFRLELDGVLKSWAVPKGPSLDPAIKRLAMHVEDHPLEYGSFEGIIPQGEYGGGTVMLWDRGEWEPIGNAREGYESGKLKFKLHGEKLRGAWMLVRTGRRTDAEKEPRQWLLFKERDEDARPAEDGDVLEELPRSVSTGRSLDEIAADANGILGQKTKSNAKSKTRSTRPPKRDKQKRSAIALIPGAITAPLPKPINVELASLAKEAPEGANWFHEIKYDGYRILCLIDNGRVTLFTRNHKNWTDRLAVLAEWAKSLPVQQAILDGEVVALRSDGTTDFQALQNAFREHRADALEYYAFDLLYLDGFDLRDASLEHRKRLLGKILQQDGTPRGIHFSEHVQGSGGEFFQKASDMGLEGIISKRRDQPYQSGRGSDWLKIKCSLRDEFVIGGYTDPTGSRTGFGALLIGYHNDAGDLVYGGKVGTGFDNRTLKSLRTQLEILEQEKSPFVDRKGGVRGTHWVAPNLVAQIAFGAWTDDGFLRHAAFQGLREDKSADQVKRDTALAVKGARKIEKAKSMPSLPSNDRRTPKRSDSQYDVTKQQFAGVRLTSPDKVLYPDPGITKRDLAGYYQAMAEWILPHIKNRPLVLVRCPEGITKECFYQKHPGAGTPAPFRLLRVKEKSKTGQYVMVDDVAGLISVAQISALEIHAWSSREDMLERPDRLIFDLDPGPQVPWSQVVQAARQVRQFLQELGLESFVKTTGGKGLHLVVPIERRHDWVEVKAFCKDAADLIVAADPKRYTANMAKAERHGKIYIDYLRNARGATAIVPYSTRALSGAPVSVPLTWAELSARVHSDHYTVQNIQKRLASLKRDPWEGMDAIRQGLTEAIKQVRALSKS